MDLLRVKPPFTGKIAIRRPSRIEGELGFAVCTPELLEVHINHPRHRKSSVRRPSLTKPFLLALAISPLILLAANINVSRITVEDIFTVDMIVICCTILIVF
jgi:hypothetical protein